MNKGFTLVELLAVIIILAVIALITTPIVLNVIDKSNLSALKTSAHMVIKAGDLYFQENQLNEQAIKEETFILPDSADILDLDGKAPNGEIRINKNGKIALAIFDDEYCITKGYEDSELTVYKNSKYCLMPIPELSYLAMTSSELGINTVSTCLLEDTCDPGTAFVIPVNNNEIYKFYVLSDLGNEISLIMDRNLGDNNVAWVSKLDYNDNENYGSKGNSNKGPITAIKALKERTTSWVNVLEKEYIYNGIAHDGETKMHEDIIEKMRARMLTIFEQIELGCQRGCPNWLYDYIPLDTTGYWTSNPTANGYGAYHMYHTGQLWNQIDVHVQAGVRPVITLYK